MLCPKVWHWSPPQHYNEITGCNKSRADVATIRNHYFNHSISVVLPHSKELSVDLTDSIVVDTDYYKIQGISLVQLVDKEFIEAFVKKGELTLLSVNTKIDLDSCICIAPSGQLILSLAVDDYQKLGIEGKPTYFDKNHKRYGKS